MKEILYIICLFIAVMTMIPSFGQQQDDDIPPLWDTTPRTAYAKHIQLPEAYASFIFELVNQYVGKAGADKTEDWWHQKGPFLTIYKMSKNSKEFCVILRARILLRGSCYYTYLGKYLLVSSDPFFEKYVDDEEPLKIEYIEFAFVEEPIYWCIEEKEDSLYITDKYTPFQGVWSMIK